MEAVTFKIFRFDGEKDTLPRFQDFPVPLAPGMTVLDGLFYVQEKLDGSLAFRVSCRSGVCGSCAMHINGVYRLACETQVKALGTSVVAVRPLGHLKVIRDLFVDMGPFWEKVELIKPYLIPGESPGERERVQTPDEREKLEGLIDCILCGACHSACTMTLTDPQYLGPAALLKVRRFIADSRDSGEEERLRIVDGEHGVWRCHTIFSCQKVCPKSLDPPGAISSLKNRMILNKLGLGWLHGQ